MTVSTSYTQYHFRLRNDDGNEAGATWVASEDSNASLNVDTNYRARFGVIGAGASGWTNQTWNLYCSKNAGAYTAIASGQAVKYSSSSNFAQGDDTTRQLGAVGTFLGNNNGMCESAGAVNSGVDGNAFEVEFSVQIDSAQVANGDTITLRVYRGTTALNIYSFTPSITVSEGGGGGGISIPVVMHHLRQQGIA